MKVTNVQFLLQYLMINPGSTYTQLTKALCAWKGRRWDRGQYSRYFSSWQFQDQVVYPGRLWEKYEGKWYLTPRGQAQFINQGV